MALMKQTEITLFRGASSTIKFDFSNFEFASGSKCVFTLSTLCGKTIKQIEFNQKTIYYVVFKDEETINYENSRYIYNIMYIKDDERYPMCLNSDVIIKEVCNEYESN